jgi:ATP-dependent Clp protease ATP-binding subunit ClpB
MTSNIGSQAIQRISQEGGDEDQMRSAVTDLMQAHFLPEFLNRIDETIIFHPLERGQIRSIVGLQLDRLLQQLEQQSIVLEVTEAAKDAIAAEGYDPVYGARPLKRVIQHRIQNPLATQILRGTLAEGTRTVVDYDQHEYVFKTTPATGGESASEPATEAAAAQ